MEFASFFKGSTIRGDCGYTSLPGPLSLGLEWFCRYPVESPCEWRPDAGIHDHTSPAEAALES